MKRSRAVPLTLVASATSLAACAGAGPSEPLRCVDQATRQVVADTLCKPGDVAAARPVVGDSARVRTGGSGISPFFLWYFGGRMVNGMVQGGGYAPLNGRRYQSPSGVRFTPGRGWSGGAAAAAAGRSTRSGSSVRGGFGRTGAGRGGFGG